MKTAQIMQRRDSSSAQMVGELKKYRATTS